MLLEGIETLLVLSKEKTMSTTYPIAGQKFPKENKTTAPYPVKNLAKAIKRHSYFQWNLLTF